MVASDINRGKVVEVGKKSEGGKNGNKKDFLRKKHRFLGRSVVSNYLVRIAREKREDPKSYLPFS